MWDAFGSILLVTDFAMLRYRDAILPIRRPIVTVGGRKLKTGDVVIAWSHDNGRLGYLDDV
jgi:hypothetical protein